MRDEAGAEVVRRVVDVFNRYAEAQGRNDERAAQQVWAEWADLLTEDFEYTEDPKWPGAQTYRGPSNFRRVFDSYFEALGQQTLEAEDFHLAPDARIVVFTRWRARGAASGAETEMSQAAVISVEGDRLASWAVYFDRADALGAVGLAD